MTDNFVTINGFSHFWPLAENPNLRYSKIIETGYEYLRRKTFKFFENENTYEKLILDVYNTNKTFIYRSYPEPKFCFLRTEIGQEQVDEFFFQVDPSIQRIYTLGEGLPGRIYHLTEFNQNNQGAIRYDLQQQPENDNGDLVKLFASQASLGQVSGEVLTFKNNLPEIIYEEDGIFYNQYSIELPSTFNTTDMLKSYYENQLVEYDNLGLYKGVLRNKTLQEFQERTQGFTYKSTFEYGAVGTIFVTKVKTINNNDILRFKKRMKNFDADLKLVDIKNFFPYGQLITVKLTPGIYDITKINLPYTNKDQADTYCITVNPVDEKKILTFKSNEVFSIEPNSNAYWGGWDDDGTLPESFYEQNPDQRNFATANSPEFVTSYPVVKYLDQVWNDYPFINGQPNWNYNLDTFQNVREVKRIESTVLHKLTEEEYIDGIWRCYTQEPYSSIYNTEF